MPRLTFSLVTALALATIAAAQTGTWQIDPNHTAAQFSVRHLGVSTVRGAFTKVTGSVKYDPADPTKTSLDATIDANSVDTRVEMRDNDLRSPRFFDVQKYPTITFHSKQAKAAGSESCRSQETLRFTARPRKSSRCGWPDGCHQRSDGQGQRMGASATTKINRQDFGVTTMPGMIGDDITITIDVELTQ